MQKASAATSHAFVTMDALRGVAALTVVEFHSISLSAHLFRHAYLAVDFFFMLSGFVLSYAYQDRLDKGWSAWKFLKVRWIRLWPLHVLGLTVGFALALIGHSIIKVPVTTPEHWRYFALNLFFIPVDMRSPDFMMFPYNAAAWSLFFELVTNAVHAVFFRRLQTSIVAAVCALSGCMYVWRVWATGSADMGLHVDRVDGYARVLFAYTVGMLFFRFWRSGKIRFRVPTVAVVLALAVLLAAPVPTSLSRGYDLACALVLLPLIVYASIYADHAVRHERLLQALGVASYGIYVLQFPVIEMFKWFWKSGLHRDTSHARPVESLVLYPTLIAATLAADRWVDVPVRRWLRTQWHA